MFYCVLLKHSRCKELDGEHANGCGGDEVHVGNSSRGECVRQVCDLLQYSVTHVLWWCLTEALDDPLADFSLNDERADEVITSKT